MNDSVRSNRRIAKNTLLLYFRMIISLGISLYTSRIILNTLGVEDYGIYNVVGSVVAMFSFLNNAMASSTQRFLTFELGTGNSSQLQQIFSTSLNIHFIIAIFILLLSETAGLWFLNNRMVIPPERTDAAFWAFQFSVLSSMILIISVPYNSIIIAHERMNVFAYISIFDVTAKLAIVFVLNYSAYDKLKLYSVLLFMVTSISYLIYRLYCRRSFSESKYVFYWNRQLFKNMVNFAGWNLFGNLALVAFTQGLNILLNVFFGPVVNAARGIAVQVQAAVFGFVSNFQTAINPQITKSYANGNLNEMHDLVYNSSRFSFYLLLFFALPFFFGSHVILVWWLKVVPEHTSNFLRLILLISLLESLANPLVTSAQATGKIKIYQLTVGGLLLLILPVSYFALRMGLPPESVFIVHLLIVIIAQGARLWMVRSMIRLSVRKYFSEVVLKTGLVTVLSIILPFILYFSVSHNKYGFFVIISACILSVIAAVYYAGMKKSEREFIHFRIKNFRLNKPK